ncbi:lysostaphin resistance A-like protein [Hominifimenecus sp. rT4P-3]|uniref:CPBP family intramembrane glutamic endopeptidase n=1 Tax=Hominifimenecus sp. rT4P-3 TaxID=3242979 RepID=UPI003DA39648
MWRVLYPALAYWGVTMLVSLLFSAGALAYVINQYGMLSMERLVEKSTLLLSEYLYEMNIASALATLPLMLWFRRMDQKRAILKGGQRQFEKVKPIDYIPVVIFGISACILLNNLMNLSGLMGVYQQTADELSSTFYQGHLIVEILGVGFLVPVTEELVFRGLTMTRMEEYWGKRNAVLLSAFVFAVIHGNFLQGLYTLPLGLMLGYVYAKYRSIAAPILFHVAANLVSVTASELGYLDFMADSEPLYWGITMGMGVVVLGVLYVIQNRIWVKEITRPSEAPSDDR